MNTYSSRFYLYIESFYRNSFLYPRQKIVFGKMITFTDATNFVADVVYPGEGEKAKKRVRSRITRAQNDGEAPVGNLMDASQFFTWATHHEEKKKHKSWKWRQALLGVEGLPIAPVEESRVGCMGVVVQMEGEEFIEPGNESELREAYGRLKRKEKQGEADRVELEELREFKRRHSQDRQKAWHKVKGKQGPNRTS